MISLISYLLISVCLCVCVQGRTAPDLDEPLRIEEDSHWTSEQV